MYVGLIVEVQQEHLEQNHKEHWYWFPTHVVKELEKDLPSGSTHQR